MNYEAHYRAIFDAVRAALDAGGHEAVPVLHVFSGDNAAGLPYDAPFVTYRQDVERPIGTRGGGASKVLRSSWPLVFYTVDMALGLTLASLVISALTDEGHPLTTIDGYVTTHLSIEGFQTLYEQDSNLFASHLRIFWERSV